MQKKCLRNCEYFRITLNDSSHKYRYCLMCESCNKKYLAKVECEKETCKSTYFGLISEDETLIMIKEYMGYVLN